MMIDTPRWMVTGEYAEVEASEDLVSWKPLPASVFGQWASGYSPRYVRMVGKGDDGVVDTHSDGRVA